MGFKLGFVVDINTCVYIYVFVNRWVCKQYYLALSGSATLEGPGHQKKDMHMLQHLLLHMFDPFSDAKLCMCLHLLWHVVACVVAFVCICCCLCFVAFVCICCGICLHLLWHVFAFVVAFV